MAEWVGRREQGRPRRTSDRIPEREAIKKRITDLWNYEKFSAPFKAGGRYFFSKNDGLQNQSVLYTQDALDAEPRLLLDPNAWSKDGTVALAGLARQRRRPSIVAYGTADAGSDWNTWHVLDVATGKPLADELKWVKFSGASWTHGRQGLLLQPLPGAAGRARRSRAST